MAYRRETICLQLGVLRKEIYEVWWATATQKDTYRGKKVIVREKMDVEDKLSNFWISSDFNAQNVQKSLWGRITCRNTYGRTQRIVKMWVPLIRKSFIFLYCYSSTNSTLFTAQNWRHENNPGLVATAGNAGTAAVCYHSVTVVDNWKIE